MTLPFRRRHHDDESVHDRARAIVAVGFLEPTSAEDQAWLETHLAACGECSRDRADYLSDRALLRSLRDDPPAPPRDLWARTASAIERESGRSRRTARRVPGARTLIPAAPPPAVGAWARRFGPAPLGAISGALVILVVVALSLVPRTGPGPLSASPGRSETAAGSPVPGSTPLAVEAGLVGWMRTNGDGRYELVLANVASVCSDATAGCATLADDRTSSITLSAPPESIVISPSAEQLIVVPGAGTDQSGTVLLVPVPTVVPTGSLAPTAVPSATPDATAASAAPTPDGSAGPTPIPTPAGSRAIASGVTVIGVGAYSPDGRWFAFSARPVDGSTGPDLYVWQAGTDLALKVTGDGATYFSGWSGGRILASRVAAVVPAPDPTASQDLDASADPSSPETEAPAVSPSPDAVVEGRSTSFLLEPGTGVRTDLAIPDVWLPSVDPTGRFSVYWTGTLRLDATSGLWVPGVGQLVLDGWNAPLADPLAPVPSAVATDEAPSAAVPATDAASPEPAVGPAGTPVDLVTDPIVAFDARFDPSGTRLAIWTPGADGSDLGTLRLVVLDPAVGAIDAAIDPLGTVPALRGFSIAAGRLAWVTPPGQDGEESRIQVLGWSADHFGQVNSGASRSLVIVR